MDLIEQNNISDNEEEPQPTFDELYPEEMDEEDRAYLYELNQKHLNKEQNYDDLVVVKKEKKKKDKKKKKNKVLDLNSFIENSKPKKWSSSRLKEKKKELNIIPKKEPRKFNPRLPIPTKDTFKKEKLKVEISFPKLNIN